MGLRVPTAFVLLGFILAGCDERPITDTKPPERPQPDTATEYRSSETGEMTGEVLWKGDLPRVRPFRSTTDPLTDQLPPPAQEWTNPNAPQIDLRTQGVKQAIVFLRGVKPQRGRRWDHERVRVEMYQQRFDVYQGKQRHGVGFVRRGDSVDFLSRDERYHVVQGRGADFFSWTFPVGTQGRSRPITKSGLVELRSGAGYFWMRAYLFVDDHPYYTRTDSQGRFRLTNIPAGEYEVVAWHPHWQVVGQDRHPETYRVSQVIFHDPLKSSRKIRIEPGRSHKVLMSIAGKE